MDSHISSWILEFLLRQQIDDWIPCTLLSILPPSDSDLHLKKTILLRRISSLLTNGSVSESILKSLEMIEEIDYRSGAKTSDSMAKAYSSVAVESAVKFLREEPEDYEAFADVVNRIWKGKVGFMRRWEGGVDLVEGRVRDLEKEMLEAVENVTVRNDLRGRDTRKEAVDSVMAFSEEMAEEMGPSFLEFAAEAIVGEGRVGNSKDGRVGTRSGTCLSKGDGLDVERDHFEKMDEKSKLQLSSIDIHKRNLPPSEKDASVGGILSTKDAMLTMSREIGIDKMESKYETLCSSEIPKAQEAHKSSLVQLQTVVDGPVLEALEISTGILCNTEEINQNGFEKEKIHLDVDVHNSSIEKGIDCKCVGGIRSTRNQKSGKCDGMSWPGFIAWNGTARTYEWDDDAIESLPKESPDASRELCLPSPKRKVISPLKKQEITRYARRRKIRKWSSEEEETLRNAVQKCGKGKWKFIMSCYPAIFKYRTEIDLKDKWRHMVR